MSAIDRLYEVKVRYGQITRTLHYWAANHGHAANRAKKHGSIQSVRKVNYDILERPIEELKLNQEDRGVYLGKGVYDKEIDIDTLLGLGSNKRKL